MAPFLRAVVSTCSTGTNRNSASRSMKVRMSQGHAARSTFTLARVIHFIDRLRRLAVPSLLCTRSGVLSLVHDVDRYRQNTNDLNSGMHEEIDTSRRCEVTPAIALASRNR